jgi:hypothetical protein
MKKEYTVYAEMTQAEIKALRRIFERQKNPPIEDYEWTKEKTLDWWKRKERLNK